MQKRDVGRYLLLTFFCLLLVGSPAISAEFPSKAIQIINPFGAGGSTDLSCRALAAVAPEFFGQPMVVVTKSGAGGSIGAAYVANARPDGYTLLMGSMATVVMRSLAENLPYKLGSFVAIGKVVNFRGVILVNGDAPWQTIADLVNDAKSRELTYGSAGVGTTGHLAIEALSMAVPGGLKLIHIPYQGSAASQAALLGKHVDLILGDPSVAVALVKEKKLKALAVVSSSRSGAFPDVPTLKESGYDVAFDVWRAVFAPKDTPEPVVAKLREDLKAAATSKVFMTMIEKMGQEYDFEAGEEFSLEAQKSEAQMKQIMEKLNLLAK
jgi:tripartite-type tricarboxylate transporter receptor subunit TctC